MTTSRGERFRTHAGFGVALVLWALAAGVVLLIGPRHTPAPTAGAAYTPLPAQAPDGTTTGARH